MPAMEFITTAIGLVFTLLVFSYLIGDNPLFRSAIYIFVGVSAGYAAVIVWHQILLPKLLSPLLTEDISRIGAVFIPLILGVLLLFKLTPRLSSLASPSMGILVGVSAAAAVGGSVIGTLAPQSLATINAFDLRAASASGFDPLFTLFSGGFILMGTVFTLAYFHFSAGRTQDGSLKRNRILEIAAWIGGIFIAITLGSLFSGVYMAALTAMIERLSAVINFLRGLFGL